jgi:hypothetical protein
MVIFSTREQQWFCEVFKLLVCQGTRVGKCTCGDETLGCERAEDIRCSEAVASATVFGGFFPVLLGNTFRPLRRRGFGETDMFVPPRGVVEAWICRLIVFIFSVFPNRILPMVSYTKL